MIAFIIEKKLLVTQWRKSDKNITLKINTKQKRHESVPGESDMHLLTSIDI